jgi:LacI family transcriptional regulator
MNIRDIARIAGVSVSTVSLVLNEKAGVKDETRIKVLSIAEKLDYVPSSIARSLVTKKTKSIGVIVPDISEVFYGALARIIQDSLSEEGYSMILCNSDNKSAKESMYLGFLKEKGVDGIIMVPGTNKNADKIKTMNTRIVFVDRYMKGIDINYVGIDNEKAGFEITEHLIKLGHKRIGCIAGPRGATSCEERIDGYKKALEQHGMEFHKFLIRHCDLTVEGGFSATEELLSQRNMPTAIFVMGDTCAIGVFNALAQENLRIPEDISIVGFDDMKFSSFLMVPLTTVSQPMEDLGKTAVQLLFDELKSNGKHVPRNIILNTKLIIRKSCGYEKMQQKY